MKAQQFLSEQLGSQGLLWAAPTLWLCPVSPAQELFLTQKTDPNLMLQPHVTCLGRAPPIQPLPQMADHDVPPKQSQVVPASQDLPVVLELLAKRVAALRPCLAQHLRTQQRTCFLTALALLLMLGLRVLVMSV